MEAALHIAEGNKTTVVSTKPYIEEETNVSLVLDFGQSHTLKNQDFACRHIRHTFVGISELPRNSYDL